MAAGIAAALADPAGAGGIMSVTSSEAIARGGGGGGIRETAGLGKCWALGKCISHRPCDWREMGSFRMGRAASQIPQGSRRRSISRFPTTLSDLPRDRLVRSFVGNSARKHRLIHIGVLKIRLVNIGAN
jgi:hypothetical protein